MDTWASSGFNKVAFEVKVSRYDFTKEMDNPNKREAAMSVSNQFYFVTPAALVQANEIPEDCGLMWVDVTGRVLQRKVAVRRPCNALPTSFIAMLLRRATIQ
jgi:hypothetical protein